MISRRLLRIKVLKVLYGYVSGQNNSLQAAQKELELSIRKTHDQYLYLFYFLPLLQNFANNRIELGKQKHLPTKEELNPNTKFVENKVIEQIAENAAIKKFSDQNSVIMHDAGTVVRKIFENMKQKEYFTKYMNNPERSFAEDKQLAIDILQEEFEDLEELYNLLEEQSIYWTDEPEFVLSNIIKTVKSIKQDKPFDISPLYKNNEDTTFAARLLRHTVVNYDDYNKTVDKFTPNWDVERIAFMDIIILIAAISEIMEFTDIPVKVTMDEYIDLARFYSTPGSSVFVNGVLDKIVQDFKTENKIQKQGLGLIDGSISKN